MKGQQQLKMFPSIFASTDLDQTKLSISATPVNSRHYESTHTLGAWYAYIIYKN